MQLKSLIYDYVRGPKSIIECPEVAKSLKIPKGFTICQKVNGAPRAMFLGALDVESNKFYIGWALCDTREYELTIINQVKLMLDILKTHGGTSAPEYEDISRIYKQLEEGGFVTASDLENYILGKDAMNTIDSTFTEFPADFILGTEKDIFTKSKGRAICLDRIEQQVSQINSLNVEVALTNFRESFPDSLKKQLVKFQVRCKKYYQGIEPALNYVGE